MPLRKPFSLRPVQVLFPSFFPFSIVQYSIQIIRIKPHEQKNIEKHGKTSQNVCIPIEFSPSLVGPSQTPVVVCKIYTKDAAKHVPNGESCLVQRVDTVANAQWKIASHETEHMPKVQRKKHIPPQFAVAPQPQSSLLILFNVVYLAKIAPLEFYFYPRLVPLSKAWTPRVRCRAINPQKVSTIVVGSAAGGAFSGRRPKTYHTRGEWKKKSPSARQCMRHGHGNALVRVLRITNNRQDRPRLSIVFNRHNMTTRKRSQWIQNKHMTGLSVDREQTRRKKPCTSRQKKISRSTKNNRGLSCTTINTT